MPKCTISFPAGRRGVAWRFPRRDGTIPHQFSPHQHEELEANLVTAGRMTYFVNGQRVEVQEGSLIWLFPEQEHMLVDHENLTMWIMVFRSDLVEEMIMRVPALATRDPGEVMMRQLPDRCVRLLDTIAQELAVGFQPLQCHDLGLAWWLASAWNAFERGEADDAGPLHPSIARAMSLLREEPTRDLKTLAVQSGLSPSQLSRLFKRQAGLSITDFRNRLRLESFFSKSNGNGNKTMLAAALDAGFGSYAQFNRVFRKQMGCSPEAYQKVQRENGNKEKPKSHFPDVWSCL